MESLLKYLSRSSAFSRRRAQQLINEGHVSVNNTIVTSCSFMVNPNDSVSIDNEIVSDQIIKIYIVLNKPDGFMSDMKDTKGRKLARDLIKFDMKLFPVGRLDYHSEGLIIFTNDGELANYITHPRFGVEKEYLVKFKGMPSRDFAKKMKSGVSIGADTYQADDIRFVRASQNNAWYKVIVNEGKNRMIRKMGEALGHPVLKLKRIRIGKLLLGDLKAGDYRHVEKNEII